MLSAFCEELSGFTVFSAPNPTSIKHLNACVHDGLKQWYWMNTATEVTVRPVVSRFAEEDTNFDYLVTEYEIETP